MKKFAVMLALLLLATGASLEAQQSSKIVTNATAAGQTGAMQTGARAASVTFTFCGTGFSGDLYVDAAATQVALAQVWTTTLTANSDCTTTYTYSPASKWYRVRWTRTAGTLNVWMAIQRGDTTAGALSGPVGGLTAGRVALSAGATGLTDDAGLTYDASTDALSVAGSITAGEIRAPSGCTTGAIGLFLGSPLSLGCDAGLTYNATTDTLTTGTLAARNVTVTALPASGAVTVTPVLSKIGAITVVAGSALADGDALSVGDGVGVVPIEFDASPGDGTTGGAVPIVFDGSESATDIRDAVKAILDAAGRDWTTSAQAANGIGLVRATPGATGGAITETVTAAGFLVTDWTNPTAATTYTYSLQACLADGKCNAAGAASSTAAGVATLSAANPNRLAWSAVTGAASYKIRRDVGGATQGVIWSGPALTVDDTGLAGDGTGKPLADMTGALRGANYKTDGNGNVASGYQSQNSLTTGTGNIASGYRSQFSLTTGGYNVASGYGSQNSLTTGSYSVASGFQSQYSLTTGAGNVASGSQSGYSSGATPSTANAITTSNTTTFIGHQSGLGSPTQRTNATAIGANAYVDADNRVVLGNGSVVDVWAGSTGQARLVGTGLRLNTGTRPTCDASTRGTIFYVAGGAGVADTCEVCVKSALDAYAWASLF